MDPNLLHVPLNMKHIVPEEAPLNILEIAPTTQKQMVYALKILQSAGGLAGADNMAKAVKTLAWGVRCIGYVRTNPKDLLEKISSIKVTNAASCSDFLIAVKKTTDFITIPPRLINALVNYGLLAPSVNIFSASSIQYLGGIAGTTKQLGGLVAIIETVRGLNKKVIEPTKVGQSLSLVGVAVSACFGWNDARMGLEIVSNILGMINLWNSPPAQKAPPNETISSPNTPNSTTFVSSENDLYSHLLGATEELMLQGFSSILNTLNYSPDEPKNDEISIRMMLSVDIAAQQAEYKSYLNDAHNEFRIAEVLEAYRNIALPDLMLNGLTNNEHINKVTGLAERLQEKIHLIKQVNQQVQQAVEDYYTASHALITQLDQISTNITRNKKDRDLASHLVSILKDQQATVSRLALHLGATDAANGGDGQHPLELLNPADREQLWLTITKKTDKNNLVIFKNIVDILT